MSTVEKDYVLQDLAFFIERHKQINNQSSKTYDLIFRFIDQIILTEKPYPAQLCDQLADMLDTRKHKGSIK